MKLGFIGYGNMASAIAQGLVEKAGMDPASIYASARNYEKLEKNAEKPLKIAADIGKMKMGWTPLSNGGFIVP